jgi:hypothetical protein
MRGKLSVEDHKALAATLEARIKGTCNEFGLNVEEAAKRHIAERVVHYWSVGMGPSPVMLTGGLIIPQWLRPTTDADLRGVRRYTETEIGKGICDIGACLWDEGIKVIGGKRPRELEVGVDCPVQRTGLSCFINKMQVSVTVDIGFAAGPYAWPPSEDVKLTEFRSFMKNGPTYKALAQPRETAIAEKWLAVITQRDNDVRAKHQVDLAWYKDQEYDEVRVATELRRLFRHIGYDMHKLEATPKMISWDQLVARKKSWDKEVDRRRLDLTMGEGFMNLQEQWHFLSKNLILERAKEYREHLQARKVERRLEMAREMIAEAAALEVPHYVDNVVAFRR